MKHDDSSTKDATKRPPDRGGRSFLRTGSSPSVARLSARWAAFSLTSAVLLCDRGVLAEDGARVHIDSPVPAKLAVYEPFSVPRNRRWAWEMRPPANHASPYRPVCDSPCDTVIPGVSTYANRFVITGSFPSSDPFDLPVSFNATKVTITVQPGSYGRQTAGFFTTLWGVIFVAPGVSLVAIGSAEGDSLLPKVGVPFLVAGGVAAITGVVLLATSGTKVKLQQLGVSPVGSAAPVKPRYWMGEF